ncbi:MAG TPA: tRNA pseudouridine(38-40) synthase TruA [Roseimicrobium sp.]|nr:tRNA pseudouridine(38-40) synthase TruA [Roseimicrobium sp.]
MKFLLTISYDGTGYEGWQIQKVGLGVQQRIEEALAKLFPSVKRIHSSSRTDTGVHALGMAAHVEIPKSEFKMTARKLPLAINAYLPDDIRIISAKRVPSHFHARFYAKGKQYRYFVWNHHAMNPLMIGKAWHMPRQIDLKAMHAAAKLFVGKHDFRSFAANRKYEIPDTVRTLHRCDIKRNGSLLTFVIEGDGFLYKMCRGIVGTLIQIGVGRVGLDDIHAILAKRDRRVAGMTAPAHGLVLWKVFYDPKMKKKDAYWPKGTSPAKGADGDVDGEGEE